MPEAKRPREHAIPIGGIFLLILVLLFICFGIAIRQYELSLPAGPSTPSYSEPSDSLERRTSEAGLNTRLASLLRIV